MPTPLRTLIAALCAFALPAFARAAGAEPGVLWENTVTMEGMPMPPMTSRFCAPKGGFTEPPKDERGGCQVKDVKNDGKRMTWQMACQDGTTGEGRIDYAKDRFDGVMSMSPAGAAPMTMKMKGRMLGEPCDAGAQRKQVDAMKQQVAEQQARSAAMQKDLQARVCADGVEKLTPQYFEPGDGFACKDPKAKAEFCARLGTWRGLAIVQTRGPAAEIDLGKGAKLCGKDPAKLAARACTDAAAESRDAAQGREALEYVATACPAEKAVIAQRECAGRSYTGRDAPAAPYQRFCTHYAGDLLRKQAAPGAKDAAKDVAVEEGKKLLKGLFGR